MDSDDEQLDITIEAGEQTARGLAEAYFIKAAKLADTHPFESLANYAKACHYRPGYPRYMTAYAELLQKHRQFVQAEGVYDALLVMQRKLVLSDRAGSSDALATTLVNLGAIYGETGRRSQAEALYIEALEAGAPGSGVRGFLI